ncbi:hypothetical protein VSP10_15985 [Myroides odoratimimus]|uniref:hypothetical protein n=1 Tax=Myroides odoratimimus TaxID=76832 RepID=UPI002DBBCF94|nr:hypothetical protein [Myroides odoratimimus]MEC4054281.1 hypothetical protein [Myroides odoratimimus]
MKNIISSFLVLCLVMVSQVGFAQNNTDIKKKTAEEVSLIQKTLQLSDKVDCKELVEILEAKNNFLLENDLKEGRTLWTLQYNYWGSLRNFFKKSNLNKEYKVLKENKELLDKLSFKFYDINNDEE